MKTTLPRSSSQLRHVLALRMVLAALFLGVAAGGIAFLLETHRTEQSALQRAADGVRHFESQAIQLIVDRQSAQKHVEMSRLMDRDRIVGIRVFDSNKLLVYEIWGNVPPPLIEQVRSHEHSWPSPSNSHKQWRRIGGERLIQVVLPLAGKDGKVTGYLESITQLDANALQAQHEQIRSGALTAFVSVLLATLLLYPLMQSLLRHSLYLAQQLLQSHLSFMRSLGNAIAKRDSDTDAHNYRVTLYAVALAEALAIPREEIAELVVGAFLHDVGKIGIPDSILLKPGKLTIDEFEIMKTHVLQGIDIVAENSWLEGAKQVIRHHHERFDGTGYPDGLAGEFIPHIARIFAVADVFDALTSERPYKKPFSCSEAIFIIGEQSAGHFDPHVVANFIQIAPGLHNQLIQKDRHELHTDLSKILVRHFGHEEQTP